MFVSISHFFFFLGGGFKAMAIFIYKKVKMVFYKSKLHFYVAFKVRIRKLFYQFLK